MAHLSVTEREYIASLLNQGINLNRIAQYLQRDRKRLLMKLNAIERFS